MERVKLLDLARSALTHQNADDTPHYRWRVILPDGSPFEVRYTPGADRREVEAHYPGAMVGPLPDDERTRPPTAEERAELVELVAAIYAKDAPADRAEALARALADPMEALTCYRSLGADRR